jgi:hypothetical protein
MKSLMLIMSLVLVSCGSQEAKIPAGPINVADQNGLIVIGRTALKITLGENGGYAQLRQLMQQMLLPLAYANPESEQVTVVLAPNTQMSMSAADFILPNMANQLLDFGSLRLTALTTNDLRRCPGNPASKCTKALIRVYTSGVAGAGFYNVADGYGVPLLASGALPEGEVGLGAANARVIQQINIPSNKHTILLSDFNQPVINVKGDFANAGAGTYTTTINVEFALAP